MLHYFDFQYFFPIGGLMAGGLLVWLAVYFVLFVLPFILILRKAGYSALWILVVFIPVVNFLFLWAFALMRWPVEERAERASS